MELDDAIKTRIKEAEKYTPFNYELCEAGLFFMEPGETADDPPTPVFVCSPIWVAALTTNERSKWGRIVEFVDHDSRLRRHEFPASRLQEPKKLAAELMYGGLHIAPGKASSLVNYLTNSRQSARLREAPERSEQEQIIEDVREFLFRHSDKFQRQGDRFETRDRAGYTDGENWYFSKTSLTLACPGKTAARVANALLDAGFLHRSEFDRLTKKVVTNEGRERLYCISGDILTHDAIPRIEEPQATPEPVYEATAEAAAVDDVFSEVERDFQSSLEEFGQRNDQDQHENDEYDKHIRLERLLDLRGLAQDSP